ncbi:flagellar export protein FliJ [Acidithiobacillus marinus]|uniref:Flagellar FliJ protein n=2 Tax=Acidithiobacillus marinus TaxID=187490 RepID=A0A2I1DN38_9PROT|nr:flagellar export protein FliJ [Acidithiobacillus marinus]
MSRQNVLMFLQNDADKKQKELAVRLGKQRNLLQEIEQKMQLLDNYLLQYRSQAMAAEASGILGAQALDTRNFIHQLEQVLQIQKDNVLRQQQSVAQLHAEWASARVREKGFAALAKRLEIEQHDQELRKIQKELDEWAQRRPSLK